jgi:hypothetical protein
MSFIGHYLLVYPIPLFSPSYICIDIARKREKKKKKKD